MCDGAALSPLRQFQLKELDLLKKTLEVFEKNGLSYFALGGTLLGAVRHKGFIPWDDDIDIGLPREDYEAFLELCKTEKLPFELHTFENDISHYRYFSRVEDPSIKAERTCFEESEITSAWIDIFPLDGMPNNTVIRELRKFYILCLRAIYKLSVFSLNVDLNKKERPLHERILIKMGKILPVEKIFNTQKQLKKLDRALKRFPYAKSNYLVNAMGAYKFREMFNKKYYGCGAWYDFEDTKIRGPVDYDYVLTQLYGDYMTPPSDEEQNHHGFNRIITGGGGRRCHRNKVTRYVAIQVQLGVAA